MSYETYLQINCFVAMQLYITQKPPMKQTYLLRLYTDRGQSLCTWE